MSEKRTILVFTATGKQGSAVIKALDKTKFNTIAATRDASSDAAKALGVELVQGSLDDPDSIFAQAKDKSEGGGIWGVLLVLAEQDPETHKKQGLAIIDAAVRYDVKHVVYSGGDFSGKEVTGIPFFDVKHDIEAHLKQNQSFRSWTILRPVGFMENFYWPLYLDQVTTTWPKAKHSTYKLIAVEDIGKIAAEAFENSDQEKFSKKEINIAGDELTPGEIADIWKRVTGQTLQAKETPVFPPTFAPAFKFFDDNQFEADVEKNRRLFPWISNFESWLKKTPFAQAA
ncbi:hypothetical protein I317_07278 [Kwoniella heveanensis CBS 569]|uniref:NmrA-like domain-containing protein n=1 Tax=Kwoniella heveanensis BCC8398 TaxID=1296120 RepID=A0A1B9GXU8_9TREE|nr:hypothetical protein I316_02361 [Kwoniella heveanensis BCC8398]OCF38941.1 hypothetical protein I317_07278 [Kwoniella heveanensis CBS 569]